VRKGKGSRVSRCMGSIRYFIRHPTPWLAFLRHGADDGLLARIDVNVLDANCLLAATPQLDERFGLHGEGSQELHREIAGAVELRDEGVDDILCSSMTLKALEASARFAIKGAAP
jgi:hypothetical protein